MFREESFMYIPPFQLSEAEACDVIKEYGFAALFSTAEGMPYATHLPLMMSKNNECLYGHFALPNPNGKRLMVKRVSRFSSLVISRLNGMRRIRLFPHGIMWRFMFTERRSFWMRKKPCSR